MKSYRKSDLFKALPIVAASLGRKFGVRVLFKGATAMTDGNTIVLPTLTEDSEHIGALWGYLAHEAAHIRFTDFEYLTSLGKRNLLAKHIHNILEDGVIERELMKVFPGTVSSLRDTCQHLIDLKLWMDADDYEAKGEQTPPAHTLSGYILFRIRCDPGLSDQADLLQGYLDRFRARFIATFGQDVLSGLDQILDRAHLNANTYDTIAMTQEIMDYLKLSSEVEKDGSKENKPNQTGGEDKSGNSESSDDQGDEQSSQGGDSDDSDSSDSSDSQDNGDSSSDDGKAGTDDDSQSSDDQGDEQSSQGGDSNDSDSSDQGDSQDGEGSSGDDSSADNGNTASGESNDPAGEDSSSCEGGDSNDGSNTSSSQQSSLRDALASQDEDAMAGDVLKPLAKAMEQESKEKGSSLQGLSEQTAQVAASYGVSPDEATDYASQGSSLDLEARRVTRKLRQQLTGLVQASRTARPYTTRRGRNLKTSRLSRLKTGDTRVFAREDVSRDPETAVHLLVDRSSSMDRVMAEMAGQATYALAIALQSIEGVKVSASSFGGTPIQNPGQLVVENPVKTILNHGQTARRMPGRFVIQPEGMTPLAPGVWSALEAFRQANAERNVLIVLTDGRASDYEPSSFVINRSRRMGVEVYGVGIKMLAHPELFDDSVLITELSQLGPELFRLARKHLIAA